MSIRVERQGLFDTIQDAGRTGFRRFGVPNGGWFDKRHAFMANLLVGNATGAACIEITQKSGLFVAVSPIYVAVAGPGALIKHLKYNSEEREYHDVALFWMNAGDELEVSHPYYGCRSYLAVAGGGWEAERILGSFSSETRLKQGDVMKPLDEQQLQFAGRPARYFKSTFADYISLENKIRFIPSIVFQSKIEAISNAGWQVMPQSNRVGIRLRADDDLTEISISDMPADRLSEPVIPGTVQWTGEELIILGVAGGTMGGYARVGQVIESDIPRLAQLRPGEKAGIAIVTLDAAREKHRKSQEEFIQKCRRIELIRDISL